MGFHTHLIPVVAGVALIIVILWDAFETILVPRRIGRRVRLTRYFYVIAWRLWRAVARRVRKPSRRQGLLGFFGPLSLILLLFCWATGLILGFALLSAGTNGAGLARQDFGLVFYMSGETFFTLGFGDFTPVTGFGRLMAVLEAGLGFGFLGTVIGYLPTMYAAFSQREIEISLMDARAGSPPTAVEFFRRARRTGDGRIPDSLLASWERWAAQVLETHISYPQLAYYRSQHSNQSWLAALVTILDTTSLLLARSGRSSESPAELRESQAELRGSQAELTFAMARHALVDITQIFVTRFTPVARERLTAGQLHWLSTLFADEGMDPTAAADFETRLAELRLQYEPYAQALAEHLLFDLPAWVASEPRHDNWRGGPWDKLLSQKSPPPLPGDEHF